jgi:hypothetical protein
MNISEAPTWFDESVNLYPYTTIIEQEWGELDNVLNWVKESLTGDYRWCIYEPSTFNCHPGKYQFYFDNEQDYMLFLLKWK